jgi:hypothetical protein
MALAAKKKIVKEKGAPVDEFEEQVAQVRLVLMVESGRRGQGTRRGRERERERERREL